MGLYKLCKHKGNTRNKCPDAWWGSRIRAFDKAWAAACAAAGCPGRIPHDLRRTAVRNMVRSRVPDG